MKTYVTYGAINAIVGAVFSLILYFLGFQTEKLAIGQQLQWLGLIFTIVVLFLGMREARENKPDGAISYGGAVGAAALISVFSGIFSAIYIYIHFSYVNPHYAQYIADFTRTQLEAKSVPEANIDAAIAMQTKMLSPVVQSLMTVVVAPIMGTLIGLILAIFVKKAAPQDPIKSA